MEYHNLKETCVIWIPKIPKDWKMVKVRRLFRETTVKGFPDEPLLVASQKHGVVSKDVFGKRTMEATKDFHLLKLVEKGDFVISLRSFQGGIELAHQRGIISPAYTILKELKSINKRYFKHLFKSKPFIFLMTLCVKGIRDGQNIDFPTFKGEYLPLPPMEEQNAIVAYLDRKIGKIQEFISKKERLIELLEEVKETFINNSVRNNASNTTEYWKLSKLKFAINKLGDGLHSTPEYVDESDYYFINGNNLINGKITITESTKCISESECKKYKKELSNHTVLYSINGTIGNIALYSNEKVALGKSAAYINCGKSLMPEFLFYVLQSKLVIDFYEQEVTGTTIFNLGLQSLKNTPISIPSIEEQQDVISKIKIGLEKFDSAISKTKTKIQKIKEYQESLITQVVTGQLKVPVFPTGVPELMNEKELP